MENITLKDKWAIAINFTPMTIGGYIFALITCGAPAIPLLAISIETSIFTYGVIALFFAGATGVLGQSFVSFFNNPESILLDSYLADKKSTLNYHEREFQLKSKMRTGVNVTGEKVNIDKAKIRIFQRNERIKIKSSKKE